MNGVLDLTNSFNRLIQPVIGNDAWRDWFSDAKITYEDEFMLVFPNEFAFKCASGRYKNLIDYAAEKMGIKLQLKYSNLVSSSESDALNVSLHDSQHNAYNKCYTFDTFIQGSSNIVAYEAAKRVAESSSVQFNPLFIHSNVGLGKTHLLNAIANYKAQNLPNQKVLYLSAEQFMNMFIRAIQQKNVLQFKDEFRSVDVLIIDDFQFLASKEATQEEFFHTFNALIKDNKQLVISADKNPNMLPGIEARLKSRLGWGMVADMYTPSYELRLSILKSKAKLFGVTADDDVLSYIAENVDSNVRILEGSLLKVCKYSEWTKATLDINLAQKLIFAENKRFNTEEDYISIVCKILCVTVSDIKSSKRTRLISRARQKLIYIMRDCGKYSYAQIARVLGDKDHTSIMYAYNKAQQLADTDTGFNQDITILKREFQTPSNNSQNSPTSI